MRAGSGLFHVHVGIPHIDRTNVNVLRSRTFSRRRLSTRTHRTQIKIVTHQPRENRPIDNGEHGRMTRDEQGPQPHGAQGPHACTAQQGPQVPNTSAGTSTRQGGRARRAPSHFRRLSIPVTWVSRVHTWSPLTAYPLGDKGLAIGFRPSCLFSVNAIQIIFTHAGLDAF